MNFPTIVGVIAWAAAFIAMLIMAAMLFVEHRRYGLIHWGFATIILLLVICLIGLLALISITYQA